jgi:hypothetical protein
MEMIGSVPVAGLLISAVMCAQAPNLSGVWKANPEKSKGIPPQGAYLVIIDQSGSKITQTIGLTTQRGEQRSLLTYDLSGKEARGTFQGLPMKSTAAWQEGSLVVNATQPTGSMHEKYTLSGDGNTLTVESDINMNNHEMKRFLVLEKQPDSAGDPLRKPEQTAAERYKNIQLMKTSPASGLMNAMRSFTMSLGTNCEFCHVKDDFASDEKPHKAMARKMIAMTRGINQQHFEGKMEVRCYTCHQGKTHPQGAPSF